MFPIGQLQTSMFPGTGESSRVWVDTIRLDEVLSSDDVTGASLLKIDVQGGELEVLRGAVELLPSLGWVYAELSLDEFYVGQPLAAEVVAFLRHHGFDLVDIGPVVRRGRADRAVRRVVRTESARRVCRLNEPDRPDHP